MRGPQRHEQQGTRARPAHDGASIFMSIFVQKERSPRCFGHVKLRLPHTPQRAASATIVPPTQTTHSDISSLTVTRPTVNPNTPSHRHVIDPITSNAGVVGVFGRRSIPAASALAECRRERVVPISIAVGDLGRSQYHTSYVQPLFNQPPGRGRGVVRLRCYGS